MIHDHDLMIDCIYPCVLLLLLLVFWSFFFFPFPAFAASHCMFSPLIPFFAMGRFRLGLGLGLGPGFLYGMLSRLYVIFLSSSSSSLRVELSTLEYQLFDNAMYLFFYLSTYPNRINLFHSLKYPLRLGRVPNPTSFVFAGHCINIKTRIL